MRSAVGIDPSLRQQLEAIWPAATHTFVVDRTPQLWRDRDGYLLLPRSSRPATLLPTTPASAVSAALARVGAGATATARVRGSLLSVLGRFGIARLVPRTMVINAVPGAENFVSYASEALGEEVIGSIRLGPPRANRKPVLTLMRRDGSVIAYSKLGVNSLTNARIEGEASALTALGGVDLGHMVVPVLLQSGTWQTSPYLLLTALENRSASGVDHVVRDQAARDLVAAFPTVRTALATAPWWRELRERLADQVDLDDTSKQVRALVDLVDMIDARSGSTELVFGAQHGDWTPWNLQTVGDRTNVWDWERFGTGVPIGLDQLHYEFHSATTFSGVPPQEALQGLRTRMEQVLALHHFESRALSTMWLAYLASVGERFVTDRQEAAGSVKGPLDTWLLPVLQRAVEDLDDRS